MDKGNRGWNMNALLDDCVHDSIGQCHLCTLGDVCDVGWKTWKDGDINKDITKVWRWFAESGERLGPYVPRSQRWMAEDDAKKKKKESQQTIQRGKRNNENPVVHIDETNGHYRGRRRWGEAG